MSANSSPKAAFCHLYDTVPEPPEVDAAKLAAPAELSASTGWDVKDSSGGWTTTVAVREFAERPRAVTTALYRVPVELTAGVNEYLSDAAPEIDTHSAVLLGRDCH
jgi:hypothetical protein